MKIQNLLYILIFAAIVSASAFPQDYLNKRNNERNSIAMQTVFAQVEAAINSGNARAVAQFLTPQSYLSLSGSVSGYYSANQAYYILDDFFRIRQSIQFKFDNVTTENNPYGTGTFSYNFKGRRESTQIFVSLSRIGNNWKISQISIN